ncbi:MAG TPA: xanthine dehydrogenase family protein subunit M [Acidimicrobiales bacterium]|nr:xanthine dehydrogenase family protein subunit M [Acidimicrobiales bacterium]
MKPASFTYHAPDTVDEAVALLGELGDDAKVLAGGQSLVPILALRLAAPPHLVDIGRIAGLTGISRNGVLTIGAGVTQRIAERSADVTAWSPLLAEALPCIAHPQIRNRGTVCGSLAHADPAAELPAVMLALDASMTVRRATGTRVVPASAFFVSYLETVVQSDELLLDVQLPRWVEGAGWSFQEISRRQGDFALAGAATIVRLAADGTIVDARLCFTGVGATPVRVLEAERVLAGQPATPDAFAAAGAIVSSAVNPPDDVHATSSYRRHIAGVLTRRTLATAVDRARQQRPTDE